MAGKMLKFKSSLLEEIKNIDWFSHVGFELSVELNIVQVSDWNDCEASFLSAEWENTTLEARNTLTSFLSKKQINTFNEWNDLIKEGQEFLSLHVVPKMENLDIPVENIGVLLSCVRWDLLGCLMENAYEKYKIPMFFSGLLEIYKMGHFPCGWQGEWSEGKLVIY